jgi:hypothetical protein
LLPAGVVVLLLITAGLQVTMPSSTSLPETTRSAPKPAAEPAEPVSQNYAAVLQRPIFAPDRAPIVLQAAATGNLNGLEVLGTAIAGNVSAALVRNNMGRIMRVKPDAVLQGWRLVSIDRTQLLFDRDGERRTIAVTAAPAHSGANPQLATSAAKSSSDDDDEDDSSSSSSNSNNSSDDDDDDN